MRNDSNFLNCLEAERRRRPANFPTRRQDDIESEPNSAVIIIARCVCRIGLICFSDHDRLRRTYKFVPSASRHALNADTIREMHLAFRRGGRKAIDKVMKQAAGGVP